MCMILCDIIIRSTCWDNCRKSARRCKQVYVMKPFTVKPFKIFCVNRTYILCLLFQKVTLLNFMKELKVKLWEHFFFMKYRLPGTGIYSVFYKNITCTYYLNIFICSRKTC